MLEDCPPSWDEEFAAIYEQCHRRLVRWLTAIFGPRDADDIAQEALLRLYQRPSLLDPLADPWPWLSAVARNVGRDLARRNQKTSAMEPGTFDLIAAESHVDEEPWRNVDPAVLAAALRGLCDSDRRLLTLRDFEQEPVGDIAMLLGMTPNAVRQRTFRARRRLAAAVFDITEEPRNGKPAGRAGSVDGVGSQDDRPTPLPPSANSGPCICGRSTCRDRSPLAALRGSPVTVENAS